MKIILLIALAGLVLAQNPGVQRTIVQRKDISAPGREAVIAHVTIAPGLRRDGIRIRAEEITYVISGEGELLIDGQPALKIKTGDGFVVPNGAIHDARNTGTQPLNLAVVYVVEKGKPIATPVP